MKVASFRSCPDYPSVKEIACTGALMTYLDKRERHAKPRIAERTEDHVAVIVCSFNGLEARSLREPTERHSSSDSGDDLVVPDTCKA